VSIASKDDLSPKARQWVRRLLRDSVPRACPEIVERELYKAGLAVQEENVRYEGTSSFPLFREEFRRRAAELGFEV